MKFVIIRSSVDDVYTYLMCEDKEDHTPYVNFNNTEEERKKGLIFTNKIIDIVHGKNKDTLKSLKIKYPKLIV
jgi:hypothetical protein